MIIDSGIYNPSGGAPDRTAREFFVFPPGWDMPASTENVILGSAITVGSGGSVVTGYMTSAGELWRSQVNPSHRIGYIPGSAAGSYAAGATVPIYRYPRIPVPKRTKRGGDPPAAIYDTPSSSLYQNFSLSATGYQRVSNTVTLFLATAPTFIVGETVTVEDLPIAELNGDFVITSTGVNFVRYTVVGANIFFISTSTGRASVDRQDYWRRIHQFRFSLAGTAWGRCTGPEPQSGGSTQDVPNPVWNSTTWNWHGVRMHLVLQLAEPYQYPQGSQDFNNIVRVWAPVAAENTPDFAIDADIPGYSTVRIVWVDRFPQASLPASTTAPYTDATRTGRPRGHTDTVILKDNVALWVKLKEDGGYTRSIVHMGSPIINSSATGPAAIRSSLIGSLRVRIGGMQSFAVSAIGVSGQWYRYRPGGDVAVGSSFALAFSTVTYPPGITQFFYVDDTIAAPSDPSWGDAPASWYLRLTYTLDNGAGAFTTTYDMGFQGHQSPNVWMRRVTIWPDLVPWPFDVPRFPLAADQTDVRYVGHPGWLLKPVTIPTLSATPPTLGRSSATTLTSAPGTASCSTPAEANIATNRLTLMKGLVWGGANSQGGSSSISGTESISNGGFSGQTVQVESVDLWRVGPCSWLGGSGPSEFVAGKVVGAVPP